MKFFKAIMLVLSLLVVNNNVIANSVVNHTINHNKHKVVKVVNYEMTNTDCLVINTFKEASIATEKEQKLINSVVLNRVNIYGKDACAQVFAPKQFSWTNGLKVKRTFNTQNDMLTYYKIPLSSYDKLTPVVTESILEHSVIAYKSNNASSAVMYHDKSIKRFPDVKKSDLKVVAQTKYFVWYKYNANKKILKKVKA